MRNATQHPYLLSLRGDRAGAEAGLAAAKQRFPDSVGVHWSEGWIRLNLLDFEGALVAWQEAQRLHGGQPFWVPYSKAIALMGAGDGGAALASWRLAQVAFAPELDTAGAARNRFQHWRAAEKALLEQVIDLAYLKPDQPAAPAVGCAPGGSAAHHRSAPRADASRSGEDSEPTTAGMIGALVGAGLSREIRLLQFATHVLLTDIDL